MSVKREKPRLSKGILDMKFMQRTKVKVDKETDEAEGRKMYAQEITDKMRQNISNFIIEPSFVLCEGLIEGRFSVRGMNPEIERLLEEEKAAKNATKVHVQPTEVSDAEMAKFYYSQKAPAAQKSMQKKFEKHGKRKLPSTDKNFIEKKTKFLKPQY